MADTFVIVNPASGNGKTGRRWPGLDARMRAEGGEFDVEFTREPGHARLLAGQAAASGARTIIVVGGDGTLNEVVNGLIAGDAPAGDVALGILPVGTGSDFARAMGTPRDPLAAAVHLMRDARPQPLDVGRIDCVLGGQPATRYFANVAGLGFDGEVADRVNRSGKSSGTLTYQLALLQNLGAYKNKHVRITIDGEARDGVMNSVILANARYFGGGMFIAPNARWDDGRFDVILLGDFGKLEVVANLPRLYRGTHLTHPKVTELRAIEVKVEAQERAFIQAEGELAGEAPATFRILPGMLKILR